MTGWNDLAPVAIASSFLFGMVLALPGTLKAALAQRLGLDEAGAGGVTGGLPPGPDSPDARRRDPG